MTLDVDPRTVGGSWLRHTPHGGDPRYRPSPPDDNRWQRGHIIDALYLAKDEPGLWAEWYRHLAERGIPPMGWLPRDQWTFRVTRLRVADLSDEDRLARVGLAVPEPGRKTWPPYQKVGEKLASEGWAGLLAPSAARPRSLVLCVFLPNGTIPGRVKPVPPPTIVKAPPTVPTGMRT